MSGVWSEQNGLIYEGEEILTIKAADGLDLLFVIVSAHIFSIFTSYTINILQMRIKGNDSLCTNFKGNITFNRHDYTAE